MEREDYERRRPRVREGFEFSGLFVSHYNIRLKRAISHHEYWANDPQHKCRTHYTELGVDYEYLIDFIRNVIVGMFEKRICKTLNFHRGRTCLLNYWAERDEYFEEIGLPEHIDNFIQNIEGMCIDVLKDEYPLCINIESCGFLGENPDNADIVIEVIPK